MIAKYKEFENEAFKLILKNIKEISEDLTNINPSKLELIDENLNKFELQTKSISTNYKNISNHPWYGFKNNQINPYERGNLVQEFRD